MRLATYDTGTGPRCGVLQDDRVVDVTALLGGRRTLRDVHALLELGDAPIERVRDALQRRSAPSVPLSGLRLRSPILRPPTIRDFMVFEEHATAQGTRKQVDAWYRMPVFYFSNTLCIYGPDDTVPYPSATERLDYELELACVIGREGRNVPERDALSYVAGFCILNDWTARDLQREEMTAYLGPAKAKDPATSLGPWLVTTDELLPLLSDGCLRVRCTARVNGDVWCAESDAGQAYHTWGAMIERASWDSRIVPGDVLGSGTVGGGSIGEAVHKGYEKARWLLPGDVVEFEVEGIGTLRNTVGPREDHPECRYRAKEMPSDPRRGAASSYRYERKPRA